MIGQTLASAGGRASWSDETWAKADAAKADAAARAKNLRSMVPPSPLDAA